MTHRIPRERVLDLWAEGLTRAQIAHRIEKETRERFQSESVYEIVRQARDYGDSRATTRRRSSTYVKVDGRHFLVTHSNGEWHAVYERMVTRHHLRLHRNSHKEPQRGFYRRVLDEFRRSMSDVKSQV